jgi:hypothetical protein
MSRKPKTAPRVSESPDRDSETDPAEPNPDERIAVKADRIAVKALQYIDSEIDGIIAGRVTHEKHDPASRIAFLGGKAAQIAAESRKAEHAEFARTKALTDSQVMAWLKAQPAEVRERVARHIADLAAPARKSVLG